MKIPLDHFEQYIEETILSRGANYFQKGRVDAFIEKNAEHCLVMVRGTALYEVRLTFNKRDLVSAICSCPFDAGPICKHSVAVLFKLFFADDELIIKKQKASSGKKKKVPGSRVLFKEMFALLSTKELQEFLELEVLRNKSFRQQFFLHFSDRSEVQSIEWYTRILHSIIPPLKAGKKSYQLREEQEKSEALLRYTNQLERYQSQKQYASVFYMSAALILHLAPYFVLNYGLSLYFGRFLSKGVTAIQELSAGSVDLRSPLVDELFEFLIEVNELPWIEKMGEQLLFLNCASQFFLTKEQAELIEGKVAEKTIHHPKDKLLAEVIQYRLMHYLGEEQQMKGFAEAHQSNYLLREVLIHEALHNNQMERAEGLAWMALEEFPELSLLWCRFLMDQAEMEQNASKKIKVAQEVMLFMEHFDAHFFQIFKSNTTTKAWKKCLNDFVQKIENSSMEESAKAFFIADILQLELRFNELAQHLMKSLTKGHLSLDAIAEYHDEIYLILGDELKIRYLAHLDVLLKDRGSYYNEDVVKYLHLLKSLLTQSDLESFVDDLIDNMQHKRSLLIKLRKFKREEL